MSLVLIDVNLPAFFYPSTLYHCCILKASNSHAHIQCTGRQALGCFLSVKLLFLCVILDMCIFFFTKPCLRAMHCRFAHMACCRRPNQLLAAPYGKDMCSVSCFLLLAELLHTRTHMIARTSLSVSLSENAMHQSAMTRDYST